MPSSVQGLPRVLVTCQVGISWVLTVNNAAQDTVGSLLKPSQALQILAVLSLRKQLLSWKQALKLGHRGLISLHSGSLKGWLGTQVSPNMVHTSYEVALVQVSSGTLGEGNTRLVRPVFLCPQRYSEGVAEGLSEEYFPKNQCTSLPVPGTFSHRSRAGGDTVSSDWMSDPCTVLLLL